MLLLLRKNGLSGLAQTHFLYPRAVRSSQKATANIVNLRTTHILQAASRFNAIANRKQRGRRIRIFHLDLRAVARHAIHGNYVHEYDKDFNLVKRHVLNSGYTVLGIQTAAFMDGEFLFGIYGGRGNPSGILRNIPWLLNWIEIFAFIITRKRIGDRIAKTDVIAK